MSIQICVFDAYGTLFDVSAAARTAASRPGGVALAESWPQIAEDWRRKQLEYSWLRAVTGDYVSFWQVTQDGLDWALEQAGLGTDQDLRKTLLGLYWELEAYAEVPDTLTRLGAAGKTCAILSNGSPDMLQAAVDSAGLGTHLDALLSVETVGIFKPARNVYDMVGTRYGVAPEQVLFVSSNGWDAAGAAAYGFRTVWVNRRNEPLDRLPGSPATVLPDLTSLPEVL